jgi:hypothetical protein
MAEKGGMIDAPCLAPLRHPDLHARLLLDHVLADHRIG